MRFWGKLIGAFCGYLLAGPLGLILGVFIGHFFDKGLHVAWQHWPFHTSNPQAQQAFFNATFSVMGHIAKADGRVSESEINAARTIMKRMGLNEGQRLRAIELFEEGKKPDFNLQQTITDLAQACHSNKILLRLFVEFQAQSVLAEGRPSPAKQKILQMICQQLGFPPVNFVFFEDFFESARNYQQGSQQSSQQRSYQTSSRSELHEAYQLLGISQTATDAEVKKAYRKMMSQHHPDKLMAKGLPEEMIKLATEKTQKIQAAYERICTVRGI